MRDDDQPRPQALKERWIVGTMTGTSLDGLDAALVRVEGRGLALRATLAEHDSFRFPDDLSQRLRQAAEQTPMSSGAFAALSLDFGRFHAEVLRGFLHGRPIHLAALHGQTVFHAPPVSWQLLQPAPVVASLGCPVVCDLRQADLAAGGQGAPITPLADWILFRAERDRAVVNLGGFCNATFLPASCDSTEVRGFDICACNQVLDAVARRALGCAYDVDGVHARQGRADTAAVARLRSLLQLQRHGRRSLGTGDEAIEWVDSERTRLSIHDLAASAALGVGETIGHALRDHGMGHDGEVLLAGGGARHPVLVQAISHAAARPARLLDAIGVALEAREAMEIAVLGALAQDGVGISLAAVTGRGAACVADGLWSYPPKSPQ